MQKNAENFPGKRENGGYGEKGKRNRIPGKGKRQSSKFELTGQTNIDRHESASYHRPDRVAAGQVRRSRAGALGQRGGADRGGQVGYERPGGASRGGDGGGPSRPVVIRVSKISKKFPPFGPQNFSKKSYFFCSLFFETIN